MSHRHLWVLAASALVVPAIGLELADAVGCGLLDWVRATQPVFIAAARGTDPLVLVGQGLLQAALATTWLGALLCAVFGTSCPAPLRWGIAVVCVVAALIDVWLTVTFAQSVEMPIEELRPPLLAAIVLRGMPPLAIALPAALTAILPPRRPLVLLASVSWLGVPAATIGTLVGVFWYQYVAWGAILSFSPEMIADSVQLGAGCVAAVGLLVAGVVSRGEEGIGG